MGSCSKMNDFTKSFDGKEIVYPAKMDSIVLRSGKYRVQLEGFFSVNRGVSAVRVYWNNKKDSITFPVTLTSNIDSLKKQINNLPEGPINFEVRSLDDKGNFSIPTFITGNVYGDRYRAGLVDRQLLGYSFVAGQNVELDWQNVSTYMGVPCIHFTYNSKSGAVTDKVIVTKALDEKTKIADYNLEGDITYQTCYKPDALAIDTFVVGTPKKIRPKGDITAWYLQNFKKPFSPGSFSGERWGTLEYWQTNTAAKNQNGGYGGYENGDAVMQWETGWGGAQLIKNGKTEQQATFWPGKYTVTTDPETGYNNNSSVYLVLGSKAGIPDLANISQAKAYNELKNSEGLNFEIKQKTDYNFGLLLNMVNEYEYVKIKEFKITLQ